MNVASSSKRSTTPPPQQVKRAKTEESDTKYHSGSPRPLSLIVANGVERIPIPTNVNVHRLSSEDLQQLTRERIQILHQQGRRVVGLPVVLNDGIVIHWVRGNSDSVDSQPGQTPLNSQGLVWSQKADRNIATHFPRRILRYSEQDSKEKLRTMAVYANGGSGTNAGDAIIIDSDEERSPEACGPHLAIHGEPSTNLDPSFQNQGAVDHSAGSDIEFISWIRPGNKVEDYPKTPSGSSREITPDLPLDNASIMGSPDPTPSRPRLDRAGVAAAMFGEQVVIDSNDTRTASPHSEDDDSLQLTREEEVAAALFGEKIVNDFNDTQTMSSDSEDEADAGVDDYDDLDVSQSSPRPTPLPPLPSLAPIRKLLAKSKRKRDPQFDPARDNTAVSQRVRRKQGREEFLQEGHSTESSEDVEDVDNRPSPARFKRVPLPKTDFGRSRRLLKPDSTDLPLVAVTMRGDCHFLDGKEKFRITGYSLPNPGVFRLVGDCCMVGDTAVLGYDKGSHQISFLSFSGSRPQMIHVTRSPHNSGPRYQDTQKRGVSCLAAMHAEVGRIKFFSGGHDGTIHKWMANVGRPDEPRSKQVASLGACVAALAYSDRDTSVVSSAQKKLHITDLNRDKTISHLLSNDIHQIHVHPQAAYVTLLEVRHLDRQIQLFDSRKGHFDSEPCLSFGHRNLHGKFSGSYTRGSVHRVHFARGSEDGCVLLWDFRNSKVGMVFVTTGRRYDEILAQRRRWSRSVIKGLSRWYTPSLRIGILLRLGKVLLHSLRITWLSDDGYGTGTRGVTPYG